MRTSSTQVFVPFFSVSPDSSLSLTHPLPLLSLLPSSFVSLLSCSPSRGHSFLSPLHLSLSLSFFLSFFSFLSFSLLTGDFARYDRLHKLYSELLKRLDDNSDAVRCVCVSEGLGRRKKVKGQKTKNKRGKKKINKNKNKRGKKK